jgi:hypothetical protein
MQTRKQRSSSGGWGLAPSTAGVTASRSTTPAAGPALIRPPIGDAPLTENLPSTAKRSSVRPSTEPLDLHEGIDDPRGGGCPRWPEHLALLNRETGELFPGRCRATNRCEYCARLFAVETSEMLLLDAMEDAPTLYVVLTARELLEKRDCRRHLYQLRKALKRRWPNVRWAVLAEFQKRGALHLNLVTKGVPADECDEFLAEISRLWCARVDAEAAGQWAEPCADSVGVVQYGTLHLMKPGQAPPLGWRGHRYSCTRDYLVRPAAVMREEARRSLRIKRALHRGLSLEVAEHAEVNRPEYELHREHGRQPGREAPPSGSPKSPTWVREVRDYWRTLPAAAFTTPGARAERLRGIRRLVGVNATAPGAVTSGEPPPLRE